MQQINFHIRGTVPIILHNAQLSDPLNEWTKRIAKFTSKRKKTEEDHWEIARLEWYGSLYIGEKGPVIPCDNLERMIRDAAAKSKMGKQVQAGLLVVDEAPIIYKGPKDPEELWKNEEFRKRGSAKVGQQRIIRTRPWFKTWDLKFTTQFDESLLDEEQVRSFVELAGQIIGLGDWRPRHGRFEVVAA